MNLRLHNSLTRRVEDFIPLDANRVTMYVCGPTVYNYIHIGNARPPVVFGLLARLLRRRYTNVVYARNITDVDDKINTAAQAAGVPISTITDRFALEGRPLSLTAQEQRILAVLATRHGQLVSRSEISELVYARDLDPDSNTLDVLIGRIRRKLAPHALVQTERGRGFRLQRLASDTAD